MKLRMIGTGVVDGSDVLMLWGGGRIRETVRVRMGFKLMGEV